MNYEKELSLLKENLDKARTLKYKAEARLEQLKHQEDEIIRELNGLGVKPENLEDEIIKLTKVIESLFKDANEMLPNELLGKK